MHTAGVVSLYSYVVFEALANRSRIVKFLKAQKGKSEQASQKLGANRVKLVQKRGKQTRLNAGQTSLMLVLLHAYQLATGYLSDCCHESLPPLQRPADECQSEA